MKYFLLLLFPLLLNKTSNNELLAYRKMMDAAVDNSSIAQKMYTSFKSFNESESLLMGYRAISELLMCKHAFNPISKLAHFNKGKKLLEQSIKSAPGNPELIFLRYTTQVSVPSLLNYSANLKTDKNILLIYLKRGITEETDRDLYCRIREYLEQSGNLSVNERSAIKNLP